MKLIVISALATLCTAGLAFAADAPSGRPGQVLDKAACQQAWNKASPDGESLPEAKARPYILNFARVDTSNDSMISAKEWRKGCNKGWISADAKAGPQSGSAMNKSNSNTTSE